MMARLGLRAPALPARSPRPLWLCDTDEGRAPRRAWPAPRRGACLGYELLTYMACRGCRALPRVSGALALFVRRTLRRCGRVLRCSGVAGAVGFRYFTI
jgi:hypothetical protein